MNNKSQTIRVCPQVAKWMQEHVNKRKEAGELPGPCSRSLSIEMMKAHKKKKFLTPLEKKYQERLSAAKVTLLEAIDLGIQTSMIMNRD